jgi:hypothetical protein
MLKLYGSVRSRGSRVLWMLGELNLPYDHKDYLPRSPETRTPEFLALNPNARVPVIDDDGFILSESMAINAIWRRSTRARSIRRIRSRKRLPCSGACGKRTASTAR